MSNKQHLEKRIDNFRKGIYAVGGSGIASNRLTALLKAFILKTYCLPIMLYGLEPVYLTWSDIELIKRSFTVAMKRCLILNKYLKTENLCYACNINPIPIEIIHRKLSFYLLLCNNPLTKKIICEIYASNTISNKSFIKEVNDIIEGDHNYENVMNKTTTILKKIKETNDIKKASQIVIDIKFYLNNPNVVNWRKLNELLIPEALADRQDAFWGLMTEETTTDGETEYEFASVRTDLRNQEENIRSINIATILQY
jgi:hypothetical protein